MLKFLRDERFWQKLIKLNSHKRDMLEATQRSWLTHGKYARFSASRLLAWVKIYDNLMHSITGISQHCADPSFHENQKIICIKCPEIHPAFKRMIENLQHFF